ncbi:glycoside hydrolase family 13 protein [Mycoplasmatota bacterium WC30]
MKNQYQINKKNIENEFKQRENDWRNGSVVYQVLVDRFSPAENLKEKLHLYQYPKKLKEWSDIPKPGPFLEDIKYCAHELDYWGGDLNSLNHKLEYIKSLGVDVVYLNPIHESLSNHKYDATDYLQITPEFGTFKDLKNLTDSIHKHEMKIMLDGVFNHVGVNSKLFLEAKNPRSPKHDWFDFNKKYPGGVRLWADVKSLPELNLENQEVKDYIYKSEDSVIRSYLKKGIDGWRLDVAFDLGYDVLRELTDSAHLEKPTSLVIGEIWNYPKKWLKSIDGLMNFTFREIILRSLRGQITPFQTNQALSRTIKDAGINGILKCWNVLDNHDVPRLKHQLPNPHDQKLAQVMQFTLPGSPNLYYGTELGMDGENDPMNRAPMRWDLVNDKNPYLIWTKSLIKMHQNERALRIGDFVGLITDQLIGYERVTDKVEDTVIVFINPLDKNICEDVLIPDSSMMNYSGFITLEGEKQPLELLAGFIRISLSPKSFIILKPQTEPKKSYTSYKRV